MHRSSAHRGAGVILGDSSSTWNLWGTMTSPQWLVRSFPGADTVLLGETGNADRDVVHEACWSSMSTLSPIS